MRAGDILVEKEFKSQFKHRFQRLKEKNGTHLENPGYVVGFLGGILVLCSTHISQSLYLINDP
jgi:hypothetical protein